LSHASDGIEETSETPKHVYPRAVAEHGEQYSADRLVELRGRIAGESAVLGEQALSVYVTGSYGRLEAWAESDIDLFFLHGGSGDEGPFPYTTFIRIAAALIDATEAMRFPAFTGDGAWAGEPIRSHDLQAAQRDHTNGSSSLSRDLTPIGGPMPRSTRVEPPRSGGTTCLRRCTLLASASSAPQLMPTQPLACASRRRDDAGAPACDQRRSRRLHPDHARAVAKAQRR
jgi:hypothetical protein